MIVIIILVVLCCCYSFSSIFGPAFGYLFQTGKFVPSFAPTSAKFSTYKGKRLVGPVSTIKTFENIPLNDCYILCDQDIRCMAGNYNTKKNECKILQKTHEVLNEDIKDLEWQDSTYFYKKDFWDRFYQPYSGYLDDVAGFHSDEDPKIFSNQTVKSCALKCLEGTPGTSSECYAFNFNPKIEKDNCQLLADKYNKNFFNPHNDWKFYGKKFPSQ